MLYINPPKGWWFHDKLSTPFRHLATKFITLEVTRVAERGFVTLEGLLDQEIASVIHKDDSDNISTQIQPGILECYIKNLQKSSLARGVATSFDVES